MLPLFVLATGHRFLQAQHHLRVVGVVLLAIHVFEQAAPVNGQRWCGCLPGQYFLVFFKLFKTSTLDAAGCAGKTQFHHLLVESDNFKELRPPVRGHGGDSHFRHNLEQAPAQALAVAFLGLFKGQGKRAFTAALLYNGIGQIGIDGSSAIGNEAGHLVGIAGTTGGHQQVGVAAQAGAGEMLVHGTRGQQGMDGQMFFVQLFIAEQNQYSATLHSLGTTLAQFCQRPLQGVFLWRVGKGKAAELVTPAVQMEERAEFFS